MIQIYPGARNLWLISSNPYRTESNWALKDWFWFVPGGSEQVPSEPPFRPFYAMADPSSRSRTSFYRSIMLKQVFRRRRDAAVSPAISLSAVDRISWKFRSAALTSGSCIMTTLSRVCIAGRKTPPAHNYDRAEDMPNDDLVELSSIYRSAWISLFLQWFMFLFLYNL